MFLAGGHLKKSRKMILLGDEAAFTRKSGRREKPLTSLLEKQLLTRTASYSSSQIDCR